MVEQYSIDEYFLDFSNIDRLHKGPIEAAYLLKDRIKNELGFTVNIGISTNKVLAKMASELKKPDMVHTIFPEEIERKMCIALLFFSLPLFRVYFTIVVVYLHPEHNKLTGGMECKALSTM